MAIILAFSFGVATTSVLSSFSKNPIGGFNGGTYTPDNNSDNTEDETFATDNEGAPNLDIKGFRRVYFIYSFFLKQRSKPLVFQGL